jgi:glycosyltransferase involved in cell wall biosynthesis
MNQSISLCTFVKNEENCIYNMIRSVGRDVAEVILVDTGSTDNTIRQAQLACADISEYGIPLTVIQKEFTNFGDIRTFTAHQASCPWVLMLDADEELSSPGLLHTVIKQGSSAYAFPRRRWLDRNKTQQTELEAYPDWQVRLFKNDKSFVWKRELHEYFHGAAVHHFEQGPVVEHFHDVYKDEARKQERLNLYTYLAEQAGVTIEGGHVI